MQDIKENELVAIDHIENLVYKIRGQQEVSAPYVDEGAPYQVKMTSLMDEEWNDISDIQVGKLYILNLEISLTSQNIEFLTALNKDEDETYAGKLSVNGEEADPWYEASENMLTVTYYFTALE